MSDTTTLVKPDFLYKLERDEKQEAQSERVVSLSEYEPVSKRKKFDIRKEYGIAKDISQKRQVISKTDYFYKVCEEVRQHIYGIYDQNVEGKNSNGLNIENYVEIFHRAMIGYPQESNILKQQIKEFLKANALQDIYYPEYYPSLVDAIFEEEFGWGPLSVWKTMETSQAAQVIGRDIKFRTSKGWEVQDFSFRSNEQVKHVYSRLANKEAGKQLNRFTKTELETHTFEGFRVSIMIPDRTFEEPVITLRRPTVFKHSFDIQENLGTIPQGSAQLFRLLSKMMLNSVVAGPPACGKSTFLLTMLGENLYEIKNGKKVPENINTLFAESSPEFSMRKLFPNSNVLHVIGKGEEFEKVITESLLRHDITRVVISEMREFETGLYLRASLQGIKQLMSTLHDLDPLDVPEIMTNLYLQYHKNNLNADNIYKRFATNIHYSITMDEVAFDKKRVTGVQFYEVDESLKVTVHRILHYDYETDSWSFHDNIPERIARMVKKYHTKEFQSFLKLLNSFKEKAPMPPEFRIQQSAYGRVDQDE